MEVFTINNKWMLGRRKRMLTLQSMIDSLGKVRDKEATNLSPPDNDGKTPEKDPLSFYESNIKKIDERVGETSKDLDHAKTSFAIFMWVFGMVLAILPAFAFAYFGLGILKMTGMVNQNILIYDTILNAVFIGSGTKPIHDAIDAIMSIKKG